MRNCKIKAVVCPSKPSFDVTESDFMRLLSALDLVIVSLQSIRFMGIGPLESGNFHAVKKQKVIYLESEVSLVHCRSH